MNSPLTVSSPLETLHNKVTVISETQIGGSVYNPSNLETKYVVELMLDGHTVRVAEANLYDHDLGRAGIGDGCFGFIFTLEKEALASAQRIEVRLANHDRLLGHPILVDELGSRDDTIASTGSVKWIGGLRFAGWVSNDAAFRGRHVRAYIDGILVAEVRALHWGHSGIGADAVPVRAFNFHLPSRFADGRVRRTKITNEKGLELPGSPCVFVAFPDGLEEFLEERPEIDSEKLRGRLFDRLMPQSLPFAMYKEWSDRYSIVKSTGSVVATAAFMIVGSEDFETTLNSVSEQIDCDWRVGGLERCGGQASFNNHDFKQFLMMNRDCEIVIFGLSGSIFHPGSARQFIEAYRRFPSAALVYSDITIASDDGKEWPVAFSAFDYERALEQGYGALLFAIKYSQALEAAEAGVGDLYRLFNRTFDRRLLPVNQLKNVENEAIHVPGFLARTPRLELSETTAALLAATKEHLLARGVDAVTEPGYGALFPAVRVLRSAPKAKVSIIIPLLDCIDDLRRCLQSLKATVEVDNHELIVLDNGSLDQEKAAFLDSIHKDNVRVAKVRGPNNFSRTINAGASICTSSFLLLFGSNVEATTPGWLEEMLGRMAESDVGAVAPTLLWPSGVVQHAGIVLGPNFGIGHAFSDRVDGECGYADLLAIAHESSAAASACLLTRRRLFLEVGGFNSRNFPSEYGDVDYCLKLRAKGHRIVTTPYARLIRHNAPPDVNGRNAELPRVQRELQDLRSAWGEALLDDPYYSPLLSLDSIPFSGLAWPPRSAVARRRSTPQARPIPPGF